MLILVYGADSFRGSQKVKELRKQFSQKVDKGGLNEEIIAEIPANWEELRQKFLTPGFLAARRLFVLKNFWSAPAGQQKSFFPSLIKFFQEKKSFLEKNILIFFAPQELKATDPLFAFLKKQARVYYFPLLSPAEKAAWLRQQAAKAQKKIEPSAQQFLLDNFGQDMWLLANELEKLLFLPDKEITLAQAEKICFSLSQEKVFALVDALSAGQKKQFLYLTEKFLQNGDFGYLLNMLIRQYRLLLLTKSYLEQSAARPVELASLLKVPPFVAQKLYSQAGRHSWLDLKKVYFSLLRLDYRRKTSGSVNINLFLTYLAWL